MADVFGVHAANGYDSVPPVKTASNEVYGRLRVINDSYVAAAAAIGTDVIVGRLGVGASIQPDTKIIHGAMGSSTTLAFSVRGVDSGTETVLMAAAASTSAGVRTAVAGDIANFPKVLTEESWLIVKIAGGEATGTIKTFVRATVD